MKKIITMIVLVIGIAFTTQAQKKDRGNKKDDFTPKQKTELAVKKMTLKLDLTDNQISQIKPLLRKQITERSEMHKKRKASKEKDTKLSSDERYAMAIKKLDKQIAFKKKMKSILNEKQYERFEKMAARKKGKKGMKGKKGKKGDKKDK